MAENHEKARPMNLLVVDDEVNIRKTLALCLEGQGHTVCAVSNIQDALDQASLQSFDIAFVDLRLGADNGLDLIPSLLGVQPWLKIVVITAFATIETAVEAMRRGATDYLPKPFTPAQVTLAVGKAAKVRNLEARIANLQAALKDQQPELALSSDNPSVRRILELAHDAAVTDAAILIRGESGTGKTVVAKAIHGWSGRAGGPFGVVSCPTLSQELLESELFGHVRGAFTGATSDKIGRAAACDGGTLLLDEIGDLPIIVQPKVLRFLQDKQYERVGDHRTMTADVRIIAATNIDLEAAMKAGRFREDLYYRLNVIELVLPPLRERTEDIVALAERMLRAFARRYHKAITGFTEEALAALVRYGWPGNIRELRNVVERAVILARSERLGMEHMPGSESVRSVAPAVGDSVTLDLLEEHHIRRVLAGARSMQEAADILGIDQATLWRRRKKYGI